MFVTSSVTSVQPAASVMPSGVGPQLIPVGANTVPNMRQTANGLMPPESSSAMHRQLPKNTNMIASPRLAPSAVTAEQALQSRALLMPEFKHNTMASRILRTSNLYAEAPRFRNQLDILA